MWCMIIMGCVTCSMTEHPDYADAFSLKTTLSEFSDCVSGAAVSTTKEHDDFSEERDLTEVTVQLSSKSISGNTAVFGGNISTFGLRIIK